MKKLAKCLFLTLLLSPHLAYAYFQTLNQASPIPTGSLRTSITTQGIFSRHDGITINSLTDIGLTEDSDARFVVGAGSADFHFAGFYKWSPIPEYKKQPAIALLGGFSYANIDDANEFTAQFHPVMSKTYEIEWGRFTPHAALVIGLMSRSGDFKLPAQLNIGTSWTPANWKWKNTNFIAEVGADLNDSFSSISVGFTYHFDEVPQIVVPSLKIKTKDRSSGSAAPEAEDNSENATEDEDATNP